MTMCQDITFSAATVQGATASLPDNRPPCPHLLPCVCQGPVVKFWFPGMLKLTGSKPHPLGAERCFQILEGGVCSLHCACGAPGGGGVRAPSKRKFYSKWGGELKTLHSLHAPGRGLPLEHRPRGASKRWSKPPPCAEAAGSRSTHSP